MSCSPVDKLVWNSSSWSSDNKSSHLDNEVCRMPVGNLKCVIPSSSLQLLEVVGRGAVGIVHKAEWSLRSGKVGVSFSFFLHIIRSVKVKVEYSSSWESISELRGVTCHVGSHSVTCHLTQVNAPRHNPSQPGQYSIFLPRRDGRLSWSR